MTTQIIITESLELTRTRAPALPVAPTEYSRQYSDQLNNVLRLYFNTLDNFVGQFALGSVYLVANLPTAVSSVGARAFVTNSSVTTFNTIVAGGGANAVPVFFDGTNWRVG